MGKYSKIIIIFCLIFLISNCSKTVIDKPIFMSGIWVGNVGFEHYLPSHSFQINFIDSVNFAQIDYPDLNSGGILNIDSITTDYLYATQKLLYGHKSYPGFSNKVIISEIENSGVLHVQFLSAGETTDSLVFGQLTKCDTCKTEIIPFKWIGTNGEIPNMGGGKSYWLYVLPDYKIKNWFYGEGIVTTLFYEDSSSIILHSGFTMSMPLLRLPEHILKDERKDSHKISRIGNTVDNLLWREDHRLDVVPPINICYTGVISEKKNFYDEALNRIFIEKNK